MSASFFFYDLETTGIRSHECRIMQFAGQRTDMELQPLGEPFNILIKLTPDVLPEPEAVLLTGITPQMTLADGITEAEFLKIFEAEIATPDTIFVGYNSVRFDDEFIRCTRYRNFYDPYDWQWRDGRSRWDLLDVVRMTRALRPDGINWPFTEDGQPTNRLELITKLNGLDHEHAHDALNDVLASIAAAQLIRSKQPKLFAYLLELRDKKKVAALVNSGQPFVYSSGKYDTDFEKTAVVVKLADSQRHQGALVYDLHFDPDDYTSLSPKELVKLWSWQKDRSAKRLPVKTLQFNRCPAVAPLSVLDEASQQRIKLTTQTYQANLEKLRAARDFPGKLLEAVKLLEANRQASSAEVLDVELQLYGSFLDDHDSALLGTVRAADPSELTKFSTDFHDTRMQQLLPRYKARNFPEQLSSEERQAWEAYIQHKLFDGGPQSRLAQYFDALTKCAADSKYADKQFLLEELQLYGQSIMPVDLAE